MIVVPVLITNCHVLEKPKKGPVTPQMMISKNAKTDATGRPEILVTAFENRWKNKWILVGEGIFVYQLLIIKKRYYVFFECPSLAG